MAGYDVREQEDEEQAEVEVRERDAGDRAAAAELTVLLTLSLAGACEPAGSVSLPTLPFSTFNCRLSTSSVPFFSCQPHLLFWKAKNESQPATAATKRHTKEDIAP